MVMGMTEAQKLIEIYQKLEDAGLMITAGKKDAAELMVSHDVVPVVRCAKCRYYETAEYYPDGTKQVCRLFKRQMQEDNFCSYGERRTDEN